jgi:hypothetical protein
MTQHTLLLSAGQRVAAKLSDRDFVWRPRGRPSSFDANLSPGLEELAGAQRRNIEFVRLAALIYMVDRTQRRPLGAWSRKLSLSIPVWDPEPWNDAADELAALLGFLTSDTWDFKFRVGRTPRAKSRTTIPASGLVSLFSGGADSLCGALASVDQFGRLPTLVSHRDSTIVAGVQNQLVKELAELLDDEAPVHVQARLGRIGSQPGSGIEFQQESTSRSRSLLFIALGLAVASAHDGLLWIPENGFASLNPPLGGERRGSLSTRTTHPWYLWRLREILVSIGAHAEMTNPFETLTKGEMFARIAELHGSTVASKLISQSNSCARGDIRFAGMSGVTSCGICFGCLVRRAAFKASSLDDQTGYVVEDITQPAGATEWLTNVRRRDLEAARYAAARGLDQAAILSTPLHPNVDIEATLGIAERGLTELGSFVL